MRIFASDGDKHQNLMDGFYLSYILLLLRFYVLIWCDESDANIRIPLYSDGKRTLATQEAEGEFKGAFFFFLPCRGEWQNIFSPWTTPGMRCLCWLWCCLVSLVCTSDRPRVTSPNKTNCPFVWDFEFLHITPIHSLYHIDGILLDLLTVSSVKKGDII